MSLYIGWSLATIIFLGVLVIIGKMKLYVTIKILQEMGVTEEEFLAARDRIMNRKNRAKLCFLN